MSRLAWTACAATRHGRPARRRWGRKITRARHPVRSWRQSFGGGVLGSELSSSFSRQGRILFLRVRLSRANAFAAALQETETGKAAPEEREGPRFRHGYHGPRILRWIEGVGQVARAAPHSGGAATQHCLFKAVPAHFGHRGQLEFEGPITLEIRQRQVQQIEQIKFQGNVFRMVFGGAMRAVGTGRTAGRERVRKYFGPIDEEVMGAFDVI